MTMQLHECVFKTAERHGSAHALKYRDLSVPYETLARDIVRVAQALIRLGLARADRVATYIEKRPEAVTAMYAAAAAGGVFVPVNSVLKAHQVSYILRDCNVRVLVTTPSRLSSLKTELANCPDLQTIVVVGDAPVDATLPAVKIITWKDLLANAGDVAMHRTIDSDMAAILYTSGSTGKPKGVVLSHRNMVTGAVSVSTYLENRPDDRILAVLPLSFDYGFSQLSTAFYVGACTVLLDYLLPRDVVSMLAKERITGLAAVPPLWAQLTQFDWPEPIPEHLRYITNSGGAMPRSIVSALRARLPKTSVFLMYGLTEAFRSTFLPPSELDRRPDSIGKAIPNAEIMVVRPDGTPCAPDEPGELVHRGPLVAMGYWNDPEKTSVRFKPTPQQPPEIPVPEIAVWSGDLVRTDAEGYLYFVSRNDEMIKTSGYRVSPTEIEEVVYGTGLVAEAAAFGVAHPTLGQAIVVIVKPAADRAFDSARLVDECKRQLPPFMVPALIEGRDELPRNPNGKIDRKQLAHDMRERFQVENVTTVG